MPIKRTCQNCFWFNQYSYISQGYCRKQERLRDNTDKCEEYQKKEK